MSSTFDVIIVGSGTAGLVVATRLSEDPDLQVLVIEAGEDLTSDSRVDMPAMSQSLIKTPANWGLRTVPQKSLNDRHFPVFGGRVLGGSSALNTFIFIPPPQNVVDAWCALGNPGWDWASFSSSMEYAYTVEDSPWGRLGHGPVQVSFAGEETQWPTVWRETIANLGFPVSMNPFSGDTCGAHMDPESVDPVTKLRSYAASAYLAPARGRKNLTIWTETLVEKVIFDRDDDGNPVATGVQYLQKNDNIPKIVQASREVILSAGAIHSPKILELSGVGNPAILEPLGIDVVVANAHVGENLQNHLFVTSTCEVSKETGFETLDGLLKGDEAAVAAAQEALMNGRGPLTGVNTAGSAQLPLPFSASEEGKRNLEQLFQNTRTETEVTTSGFAKAHEEFIHSVLSSQTEASALYSLFPGYMAFDSNGDLLPHPGGLGRFLTFAIYLAHPLSRGSVHITSSSISSTSSSTSSISTNESADLEIDPNYLSHPADIEVLVRHLQVLENLKKTSPLSTHIFRDGNHISAKSELDLSDLSSARAYVRKHCQSAYHFTGTCAQMSRELGGVVDAGCRVHGCVNLRVVDLSIVPIIPGCNTQATAYGVAEHAAGIIRADISGR